MLKARNDYLVREEFFMKNAISILNKYGTYTNNGITFFALSETEEALSELGYEIIPAFAPEAMTGRYHGTKLSGRVVCYASGNERDILEGVGYDVLEDKDFILNHGTHLWMKEHGHKTFAEPYGY